MTTVAPVNESTTETVSASDMNALAALYGESVTTAEKENPQVKVVTSTPVTSTSTTSTSTTSTSTTSTSTTSTSTTSTSTTSTPTAQTLTVGDSPANNPQPSVRVAPGDTLTSLAQKYHTSVATLEKENPQITRPNVLQIGDLIKLPEVVPPLGKSAVKPIITAYNTAQGYDNTHDISALSNVPYGALTASGWDTLGQSDKNWDAVGQTTYNTLINNNHVLFPNKSAATEVKGLDSLEPKSTQFADQNQTALNKADTLWTNTGIIAYSNYKTTGTQAAKDQFLNVIDTSFAGAAGHASTLPSVIKATGKQAASIAALGPAGQAFAGAVGSAAQGFEVGWAADSVANAYNAGGAAKGAGTLKTVTNAAPTDDFGLQIIQKSKGTIDKITTDMGISASKGANINQIYADLSQSVNAVSSINMSISPDGKTSFSLGADGQKAAQIIGGSIAAHARYGRKTSPLVGEVYQNAAANAVKNGNGAGLTLATAAALNQLGSSRLAPYLVEGAATGLKGLKSNTDTAVNNFNSTVSTLYELQTTWGPLMNQNQLDNASQAYLDDHPQTKSKATAEMQTISQDGDAIVEAESALGTYGPQLQGVSGEADLTGAAQSLTGTDNSTALAISLSPRLGAAVATTFLPLIQQVSGGSAWEAITKWPGWSSIGAARRAASNTQKKIKIGGAKVGLGLSVGGLALNIENGVVTGFPFSSPQEQAYSIYTGLGFFKYTSEIYSGLANVRKLPSGLSYNISNISNPVLKFVLGQKAASKDDPTLISASGGLAKSPLFTTLGLFYYGAGAVASTTATIDSTGDWIPAALNAAQAAGSAGNALKPVLTFISKGLEPLAEDIAFWSSWIGLAGTVGYALWQGISDARQNAAFRSDSTKFLEAGMGGPSKFNPALAGELAYPPTGNSTAVAAALQQYAQAYDVKPGQLLSELNSEPLYNAVLFLNAAGRMTPQSDGLYARSGTGDGSTTLTVTGKNGQPEQVTVPDPVVSLAGLKQWADAVFGPNQVG